MPIWHLSFPQPLIFSISHHILGRASENNISVIRNRGKTVNILPSILSMTGLPRFLLLLNLARRWRQTINDKFSPLSTKSQKCARIQINDSIVDDERHKKKQKCR
ncbi:hypothetical protein Droror1_Dr00015606 [Drosera rotundifolia]